MTTKSKSNKQGKSTPTKRKATPSRTKPIKRFRPQRHNANLHTPRGIELIEKSIKRDGWIGAMTVAANGEVFDGSARLETVDKTLPSAEPIVLDIDGTRPVILRRTDISDTDDARAKRLAIAANAIAAIDWNPDGALLKVLSEQDEVIAQLIRDDTQSVKAMLAESYIEPILEGAERNLSPRELEAGYETGARGKQIILTFDINQYKQVITRLEEIAKKKKFDTYSQVLIHLLGLKNGNS